MTTPISDAAEIQQIVDAIGSRQRFVISSHSRPDGDSIGSQLAMAYALRALGKEVAVVNADAAPPPLMAFPGVAGHPDRTGGGGRVRRGDHHGVRRSRADGSPGAGSRRL